MKHRALSILALGALLLLVAAPSTAAPLGTEQNPYVGKGPLGKWVKNDLWAMRVTRVESVDTFQAFQALPWTKRLTEKKKADLFKYAGRQYDQDGKLVLVTLEVKSLNPGKFDIGVGYPYWMIRADDGQQTSAYHSVKNGKIEHGGREDFMHDYAFCLKGGFPQKEKLNPQATTGGVIPLFLPSYCEPRLFYFNGGKTYGGNESLVIDLTAK